MEIWLCVFIRKEKNGKQNLGKSLQQNSRCCAWDVHKKILFCQDLSIKKELYILLSEKKEGDLLGRKKTPFIKNIKCFLESLDVTVYSAEASLFHALSFWWFLCLFWLLRFPFVFTVAKMSENNNIEGTYFCPDTLEIFLNTSEKDRAKFLFGFKFANILCRVYRILLSCCFNCHKLVIKNHQSKVECFIRYFPKIGEVCFL